MYAGTVVVVSMNWMLLAMQDTDESFATWDITIVFYV